MKKVLNFFLSILYFIAFCILGSLIGAGIGYGVLILGANGMFSSWESLYGSQQFEKIVSADIQTVWAQATDGKLYSWNTNCYRENCNQWIETSEIPEDVYGSGEKLEISNSCELGDRVRKAPRNVVECAHVVFAGAGFGTESYYALMDDGTIWMWEHSGSSIEVELMPLCGGGLGIIAGIVGFIFFMARRVTKSEQSSTSTV